MNTICCVVDPVQIVCVDGVAVAFGVGFTSTVAVVVGPLQPLAAGVTVKVTVIGILVVLVSVPDILPDPDAAIPVTVATLSLVQLYTVPATGLPASTIVVIGTAEQTVCEEGTAVAVGVGLTVTVAVVVGPAHPLAVGVIVKVTVIGAAVLLFGVPLILPAPFAGKPVTPTVLSLVQLNTVPATLPVITIVVIATLLHTVCEDGLATAFGVGLTSTVAVIGVPLQPLAVGVIVKVTVIGVLVKLVSVPLILPAPLAAIPVTVATLSRVQLYTTPATALPLSTIVVIATPEHLVCDDGVAVAVGVGLTSIVAVIGVPGQPLAVGVIVKVTVTGFVVVLTGVPLILPAPLFGTPVTATVLSLVQLYTVPATLPLITIVVIATPEHTVCDDGAATAFGVGLTNTVAVIGVPLQPFAVGVIVKVTVTGTLVVLVSEPLILPAPLAAIPVTVATLSRVQLYTTPATALPLRTIVVIAPAEQIVCDDGVAVAVGVGLTNTVAVIGAPGQALAVGVIVKVTVCGDTVVLVKVPLILPAPLAAIPVTFTLLSLVQLNTVPATLPLITIVVIGTPEQTVCADGAATAFGVGLTSTVAVTGVPAQPLAVGVTVKVTVTGTLVVLVSEPLIGDPDPLAAIPVTVALLSLVQLYTVPATALPLSTIGVIAPAEQIVCEEGTAVAVGVGLTVIVKLIGVPLQVTPLLV